MVIMANLGSGISGAAAKFADSKTGKVLIGDQEHFGKIFEAQETDGLMDTLKTQAKMAYDHTIGKDFAGQGAKRAGVVAARGGLNVGTNVAIAGTFNHAVGNGGFFKDENGQRDIAGIPFI